MGGTADVPGPGAQLQAWRMCRPRALPTGGAVSRALLLPGAPPRWGEPPVALLEGKGRPPRMQSGPSLRPQRNSCSPPSPLINSPTCKVRTGSLQGPQASKATSTAFPAPHHTADAPLGQGDACFQLYIILSAFPHLQHPAEETHLPKPKGDVLHAGG